MKNTIGNNCLKFLTTRNGLHWVKSADENQTCPLFTQHIGELWNSWHGM